MGAILRIKEYSRPRIKRLLIVEDTAAEQLSIRELLGSDDIDIAVVDRGEAALSALDSEASIVSCSRSPVAGYVWI